MSDADKPEDRDSTTLEPQAGDPHGVRPEDQPVDDGAVVHDEPVGDADETEPAFTADDIESDARDQAGAEASFAAEHVDETEPAGTADVDGDQGYEPEVPPAAAAAASAPIWDDAAEPAPAHEAREKDPNEVVEIVKTVFYALLIALVLRVLLFQPFTIPSASMEPNLYEGDYIVVSKWSYGYSRHSIPFSPPLFEGRLFGSAPERGDIVVFKLPSDNRTDYIKRVIGLPGDRIQMINGVLHVNGTVVDNVTLSEGEIEGAFGRQPIATIRETLPGGAVFNTQDFGRNVSDLDNTAVLEVPAGHYFMMGDNRDNSIDSRVPTGTGVGMVPHENLVGKAQIILFSWEPGAELIKPWTWFTKVRPSRFFTVLE